MLRVIVAEADALQRAARNRLDRNRFATTGAFDDQRQWDDIARIAPADTWMLVFRDAAEHIQFSEINAFTARLLGLLEPGTLSGQAALETVARESRHPDPAQLMAGGLAILQTLHARGAILGVAQR